MRRVLPLVLLVACGGDSRHVQPLDDVMTPPGPPLPPPTTTCYAGINEGMGDQARTVAKRVVDPEGGMITEDVSNDDKGAHGAKAFHVVMTVTGDSFTMKETGGAFEGTGSLNGDPWHWSSWTRRRRSRTRRSKSTRTTS